MTEQGRPKDQSGQQNREQHGKGGRQGDGEGYLRWMGAGIEFCGVICLFTYFGYRLDRRLDLGLVMTIVFFLISFVGMVYLFYKDLLK